MKKVFNDESFSTFIRQIKTYIKNTIASNHIEPENNDIPKVFIEGNIPTTKTDVYATLTYVSNTEKFSSYIKIKCQGSSSMAYPKKNFTIKLYSDYARQNKLEKSFKDWGYEENKFVLKANYIDHSHARNIIGAKLWDEVVSNREDYDSLPEELRTSPRNGAIDGFPIKLYANGTYQGIYTWNIGKDAWMWNMDEDNLNHVLLCGEVNTNGVYEENACNFRTLWDGADGSDWSIEIGTNTEELKTSLNNLIACVKDTDDETFRSTIENYLDIQSAIDYYIHQYVICGLDGLAKNLLLGTYDLTKWYCGAYDMDSTFGLMWDGQSFVSANYACPEDYQETFSLLWERLESVFAEELKVRYAKLRTSVYNIGNMFKKFEDFMNIIGSELYAEDLMIFTNIPSGSGNNIRQIRNFIRDRLAYCDIEFELANAIPATSIVLDKNKLTFTSVEDITLVATVEPADTTSIIMWTTSDENVAVVNNGVVTPTNNGTCTITATAGNVSATCEVTVEGLEFMTWSTTATYSIDNVTGAVNDATGDAYLSEMLLVPDDASIVSVSNKNGASFIWKELYIYDENKVYLGVSRDNGSVNATTVSKDTYPNMKYVRATAYPNNVASNNDPNNQLEFTADVLLDGQQIAITNGTHTFNNNNNITITNGQHINFNTVGNAFIALYEITDNTDAQNTWSGTGQNKPAKITLPAGSVIDVTVSFSDATVNNGEMSIFMYPANSAASVNLVNNFGLGAGVVQSQKTRFDTETGIGSICAWLQNGGVVDFDLIITVYEQSTIILKR